MNLEAAFDLQPGDPAEVFDLSGGILMRVDPNSGNVKIAFDNDSSIVTKSSSTSSVRSVAAPSASAKTPRMSTRREA